MQSSLELGLSQQLSMSPQLQQAIRLLQLSALELELEIQKTLDSNLLIERIESDEASEENNPFFQSLERKKQVSDLSSRKKNFDPLLHKSSEPTLKQHLYWQMELTHFSESEQAIAIALIDAISEEGYLLCPLLEIQQSLNIKSEVSEIEAVLGKIQQFDPLGVGARNLAECLKIQLDALPPCTPWLAEAALLIETKLEMLGKKEYTRLQGDLDWNEPTLRAVIKVLRSLNPRPGTAIASKKSEYIIPDVLAWKYNGKLIVELNKNSTPTLRLNPHYAQLLAHEQSQGNTQVFKTQWKEAKCFLKSLQTRQETLIKVAGSIMEKQQAFLDHGEEHMQPLNLQDIAQAVDLHESTVSRITTEKYILTPRGAFELKFFFSNALPHASGKNTSRTALCALIKKIISEEPSQTPFSDHKITELLLKQGFYITRRTVSKYRESMHLPISSERRNMSFN